MKDIQITIGDSDSLYLNVELITPVISIGMIGIKGTPGDPVNLVHSIADGDTTHAPDGNSVYDALATKMDTVAATAESDFIVAGASPFAWAKKTLAQVKTILGLLLTQTSETVGFTIAGGSTSKTLTVDEDVTSSNKMNKTGNNLAIGSDADGDTWYRASGVMTRLAKGTAYQYKRMNSGATAPEWADGETVWTDYSATSTVTGWASFTTKSIYYKKIGKTVFVSFHLVGTSNATNSTFTLPYTSSNTLETMAVGRASDNGGTYAHCAVFLAANSNTVAASKDMTGSSGTWTDSGTKAIGAHLFFDVA
ncbi:MAG: hypothetical protein WC332_00870 [Clostridia bacterium]|jgi:hypothetical protein